MYRNVSPDFCGRATLVSIRLDLVFCLCCKEDLTASSHNGGLWFLKDFQLVGDKKYTKETCTINSTR